jgi:hypothetical protein
MVWICLINEKTFERNFNYEKQAYSQTVKHHNSASSKAPVYHNSRITVKSNKPQKNKLK